MRELILDYIYSSKWYDDYINNRSEFDESPEDISLLTNEDLLDLFKIALTYYK